MTTTGNLRVDVEAVIRKDIPPHHAPFDAMTVYGLLRIAGWRERDLDLSAVSACLVNVAQVGLIEACEGEAGNYRRPWKVASVQRDLLEEGA